MVKILSLILIYVKERATLGAESERNGDFYMKQERTRRLLAVFWTFLKIGAFTFGGGYAMIPLIRARDGRSEKAGSGTGTSSTIVAIAESTPGPIAINSRRRSWAGSVAGFWGAFCATRRRRAAVLRHHSAHLLRAAPRSSSMRAVRYAF
jgi:hypothetical protein